MTSLLDATHSKVNPEHKQKLRLACNCCHQAKVKCSGGSPCFRCASKGLSCCYGYQNRGGKPKGSKNRKTIARMQQMRLNWLTEQLRHSRKDHHCDVTFGSSDSLTFLSAPLTEEESKMISRLPPSAETFSAEPINKLLTSGIHGDAMSSPGDIDPWMVDMGAAIPAENEFPGTFATPVSFASEENYFGHQSDTTTPMASDFSLADPNVSYSCVCIQSQAANVTSLHKLSSHRTEVFERVDLTMKSITSTLDTCTQFFDCILCKKTYSSVFLTLSAIHLIFQLFQLLIVGNHEMMETDDPKNISCCLGDYEVSKEEEQAIRNVLLKMALSKGGQTLAGLRRLVKEPVHSDSSLPCEGDTLVPCGLSSFDREYIIQCITKKEAVLEVLMKSIVT